MLSYLGGGVILSYLGVMFSYLGVMFSYLIKVICVDIYLCRHTENAKLSLLPS